MTAVLQFDAPAMQSLTAAMYPSIIAQHADDAPFLFTQRERAVRSPRTHLARLLRLDDRLEANLDGLRIAGDAGWSCMVERLQAPTPEILFTAACVALPSQSKERSQAVLALALPGEAPAPLIEQALVSALGFLSPRAALPVLAKLCDSGSESARDLALTGYAAHRLDPGDNLRRTLLADRPAASAIHAAGVLGRVDLAHLVVRRLCSSCADERDAAAFSAARLGLRDADVLESLRQFAQSGSEPAAAMLVRCLPFARAQEWTGVLLHGRRPRMALTAATALGDPSLLMDASHLLRSESTARLAGEALRTITGVALEDAGLTRPKPDSFDAGPNDDPADTNVSMDLDQDLPWPDPDRVCAWWSGHQQQFDRRTRYLCGRPIEPASLFATLSSGCQPMRAAAAEELGLIQPAQPLFPVEARAHHQLQRLAHSALAGRHA